MYHRNNTDDRDFSINDIIQEVVNNDEWFSKPYDSFL